MKVEMIALRRFPLGKESRALIEPGRHYEVTEREVGYHEETGRGRRAHPVKMPGAKAPAGKKGD